MTDQTPRDRSKVNSFEQVFGTYRMIAQARQAETMRVAGLIEMALHEAESEETQRALVDLAQRVLKP